MRFALLTPHLALSPINPFYAAPLRVSVIGFAAHWADGFGFGYASTTPPTRRYQTTVGFLQPSWGRGMGERNSSLART